MVTSTSSESSPTRLHILAVGQTIMAKKGFSGVGLNEILTSASIPKGSFYHYFASKDAFGEALLQAYFDDYLAAMDNTLLADDLPMAQRLMSYWQQWEDSQSFQDCQGKCLAVKLGAEVADLSEAMRSALNQGTSGIIKRLEVAIAAGVADGSLATVEAPGSVAQSLYELWLGASVMVKIVRNNQPFSTAMLTTRHLLGLAD